MRVANCGKILLALGLMKVIFVSESHGQPPAVPAPPAVEPAPAPPAVASPPPAVSGERPNAGPDPRRVVPADSTPKPGETVPPSTTPTPTPKPESGTEAVPGDAKTKETETTPAASPAAEVIGAPVDSMIYPSSQSPHLLPSPQVLGWNVDVQNAAPAPTPAPTLARSSAAVMAPGDAFTLYGRGYDLFCSGQHAEALRVFQLVTSSPEADARAWYFRGLAELATGQEAAGRGSIDIAARMHTGDPAKSRATYRALARVQGPTRRIIDDALVQAKQNRGVSEVMVARKP